MAVRFDANTEALTRTSMPAVEAITLTCWVKYKADTGENYGQVFVRFYYDATNYAVVGQYNSHAGIELATGSGESPLRGSASTDTWYFVSVVMDATKWSVDCVADGESITLVDRNHYNGCVSITDFSLGMLGQNWGNISVANAKCWAAALSASELEDERYTKAPVRTANLWARWDLDVYTDLTDSSGNSRHLTGNGTLSTEASDPPWGATGAAPGSIVTTITL